MDRSSGILKQCEKYDIQDVEAVELSELISQQASPQLDRYEDDVHDNIRDYVDKEIKKKGSDSGRCTPHENIATRSGSVSVRFEEMLIDVISATTIHVDWCPSLSIENIHGYKIRYAIKDNNSYNEIFVTPGISNYTISGLKPNTEYDVWVNAVDAQENVIHECGGATQKTNDVEDKERMQSSPYITIMIAAILLTTAVVVPLTVLIIAYGTHKIFDAPYLTSVAAITLLLIAVVVPITFLFVRNCGQCTTSASGETKVPNLLRQKNANNSDMENEILTSSFRHRSDVTEDTYWTDVADDALSAVPSYKRGRRDSIAQKDFVKRTTIKYFGIKLLSKNSYGRRSER